MPRLDPAAARRADSQLHLTLEPPRAMAIAVDRQRHPGGDRFARTFSFEIEMRRRAVDLERGSGLCGGGKDRVVVKRVSGPSSDQSIRRMCDRR